ncbi:GNAT family N-acetyltransferase [Parasulfitobacter algicola]|uniref:GNAT family N-acetyltransferase n=1 Tax=Parasulfitobacter algicola TaxID=2614809 RepID=A0ABX2IK40_9RHOB|nr:GNAT family N-acetyltransferase [Sulfitobacter algicola]NSX53252.1 GNAT family N-acetyltransferase [Sulfitobacter algicola]
MNPVLQTERLTMRMPQPKDWDGFRDFMTSERSRYAGGHLTEAKAYRAFGFELGHWQLRGFGSFAVCLKGTDDAIGMVGPWQPIEWPAPEIGWFIWQTHEGQGYAYEAAVEARRYVYEVLNWPSAVSYIDPANARSIALAERLGATLDKDAQPLDPGDLVYRHPAPEALQ